MFFRFWVLAPARLTEYDTIRYCQYDTVIKKRAGARMPGKARLGEGCFVKKDVIVSISGLQQADEQEPDKVELVTPGRFYLRDGNYYISYHESELTGMEGTRTTVKVGPGRRVSITRTGRNHSQLCFEPGQRSNALYQTEYGPLNVATITERVESCLGSDGGSLEIRNAVEIDNVYAATNHLKIDVRVS